MGTLASQAKIGVRVQAPGALLWGSGLSSPQNIWDCMCKFLQSNVFWPENNGSHGRPQCVLNTLTMGTPFHAFPSKWTLLTRTISVF